MVAGFELEFESLSIGDLGVSMVGSTGFTAFDSESMSIGWIQTQVKIINTLNYKYSNWENNVGKI